MIWYPYAASTQFPELGSGGRTAMAGPVYHFDPHLDSAVKLPAYYDDTLFIYEWSRNWIKEVKLDAQRQHAQDQSVRRRTFRSCGRWTWSSAPTAPSTCWNGARSFGGGNADAQLVRIEFLGTPQIVSADFDGNAIVDGADFLDWQRGLGIPGGAREAMATPTSTAASTASTSASGRIRLPTPPSSPPRRRERAKPPPLTRRSPRWPTSTPQGRSLDHTLPMIVDDAPRVAPKRIAGRRFAFAMPR